MKIVVPGLSFDMKFQVFDMVWIHVGSTPGTLALSSRFGGSRSSAW